MMKLASLIVFCPQFSQDLLVAGLAAGDTVQVAAGGFADGHALCGKSTGHISCSENTAIPALENRYPSG